MSQHMRLWSIPYTQMPLTNAREDLDVHSFLPDCAYSQTSLIYSLLADTTLTCTKIMHGLYILQVVRSNIAAAVYTGTVMTIGSLITGLPACTT